MSADPKHIDAVADALHARDRYTTRYPVLWDAARFLLDSTDPAVHAAMLDALTRHGVLTEEWTVQRDLAATLARVKAAHKLVISSGVAPEDVQEWCHDCDIAWPCPTVAAIEGDQ